MQLMKTVLRFARRDHLAAAGGLVLLALLLLGALGPWLPLGDPDQIGAGPRFAAPSWAMPFGTDELGRDLLPRVVRGIRATFVLALASVCGTCLLYTSPSPRDGLLSRMPSSA